MRLQVENRTEIMQHVLGMKEISLLPKYAKRISRFLFLCGFAFDNAGI